MLGAPSYAHEEAGQGGPGRMPAWIRALAATLEAEADRWFLWVPVALGAGIGLYVGLAGEPPVTLVAGAVLAGLGLVAMVRRHVVWRALAVGALIAALGFADAKLRTLWVASPTLARSTGAVAVEGWVERVERRWPKGTRITLRVTAIAGLAEEDRPYRVRITQTRAGPAPATGTAIRVKAVLRPVPEPVRPGGFDFARKAWFARLGGVGFAVRAPEPLADPPEAPLGLRLWAAVDGVRKGVEARIERALPGVSGAVAMALITGERGAIPKDTLTALRESGLAHVLAISGLHMALFAGALFWLVRAVLAAVPALALRYQIKKWAACAALAGGGFYLALSGAAIATQRAFMMMAIVVLAILLDRPALTLRNVALAATVILVAFPESLFDVSFQMSFAAVTALVAVYEESARRRQAWSAQTFWHRTARAGTLYFAGIALTTLVASLAVAPFAAYHFHKLAQYGLIANLIAMPVVGLLVMPMALLALLAMPLGLEAVPLGLMAAGIDALVAAAEMVSGWRGAVVHVAAMPLISLVLMSLGGLWLCLWRRPWRAAGLVLAGAGLAAATSAPRPDILIARDGALLAVRQADGVLAATANVKRASYSLEKWLLADGDGRPGDVFDRANAFRCDRLACLARIRGQTVAFVRHPAALREECAAADIVVAQIPLTRPCAKARVRVDRIDLWAEGAHAIYFDGQSLRVESVAARRGTRPWVRQRAPLRGSGRRDAPPAGQAYAGEGAGE